MYEVMGMGGSLDFLKQCFQAYFGSSPFLWFYLAALVWLLHTGRKEREKLVYPLGFLVLLIVLYNPLSAAFLSGRFVDEAVYYRFLWLMPVPFVIAYAGAFAVCGMKRLPARFAAAAAVLLILIVPSHVNGELISRFAVPENIYKVPSELIEICRIIHEDDAVSRTEEDGDGDPRVVFSDDLEVYARQYDPSISLTIDRDVRLAYNGSLVTEKPPRTKYNARRRYILKAINEVGAVTEDKFRTCMENSHTRYIVIPASWPTNAFLMSSGCKSVAAVGAYTVYRYQRRA